MFNMEENRARAWSAVKGFLEELIVENNTRDYIYKLMNSSSSQMGTDTKSPGQIKQEELVNKCLQVLNDDDCFDISQFWLEENQATRIPQANNVQDVPDVYNNAAMEIDREKNEGNVPLPHTPASAEKSGFLCPYENCGKVRCTCFIIIEMMCI